MSVFKVSRIRMRLLGRNLLSDAEAQVPHAVHRIGCPLVLRPAGVQDLGLSVQQVYTQFVTSPF
jgi:hypothetical protein